MVKARTTRKSARIPRRSRKSNVAGNKVSIARNSRNGPKKAALKAPRRAAKTAVINKPNPQDEFYTDEGCWILEVCRDNAVTVARARVAPGVTTKAHSLRGVVERYVIIEGKGIVRVGGNAPGEVGPGDVVSIPPRVSQSITNHGAADLIFYCICTPPFTQSCYKSLE